MLKKTNTKVRIPAHEIKVSFTKSSGAGGQNVNKTATKVIARWSIDASNMTVEEKARLQNKIANRINSNHEVVVSSDAERSQTQNRVLATARLQNLVSKALSVPKKRRPTRPTKASKLRRLENKKIHSLVKVSRRKIE